MKHLNFSGKITNKYAFWLSGFERMPYSSIDGDKQPLAVLDCWLTYDEKVRDHSPSIMIYFEILGFTIVDFSLYNVNHALVEGD